MHLGYSWCWFFICCSTSGCSRIRATRIPLYPAFASLLVHSINSYIKIPWDLIDAIEMEPSVVVVVQSPVALSVVINAAKCLTPYPNLRTCWCRDMWPLICVSAWGWWGTSFNTEYLPIDAISVSVRNIGCRRYLEVEAYLVENPQFFAFDFSEGSVHDTFVPIRPFVEACDTWLDGNVICVAAPNSVLNPSALCKVIYFRKICVKRSLTQSWFNCKLLKRVSYELSCYRCWRIIFTWSMVWSISVRWRPIPPSSIGVWIAVPGAVLITPIFPSTCFRRLLSMSSHCWLVMAVAARGYLMIKSCR